MATIACIEHSVNEKPTGPPGFSRRPVVHNGAAGRRVLLWSPRWSGGFDHKDTPVDDQVAASP